MILRFSSSYRMTLLKSSTISSNLDSKTGFIGSPEFSSGFSFFDSSLSVKCQKSLSGTDYRIQAPLLLYTNLHLLLKRSIQSFWFREKYGTIQILILYFSYHSFAILELITQAVGKSRDCSLNRKFKSNTLPRNGLKIASLSELSFLVSFNERRISKRSDLFTLDFDYGKFYNKISLHNLSRFLNY